MEQSLQAGLWIAKYILEAYALDYFDGSFVSMSTRSLQSAVAMEYENTLWQGDTRLNERNRGEVRGLKAEQHRQRYPASYQQMQTDPLHWLPPGGESILDVAERWRSFYHDIKDMESALIVGHRDQMWAAMQPLEHLSESELLAVNTDDIHNAQIIHYTSLDPETGQETGQLQWKRSIDPMYPDSQTSNWQKLR